MKHTDLVKRAYIAPELSTYGFAEQSVLSLSSPSDNGWGDDGYSAWL